MSRMDHFHTAMRGGCSGERSTSLPCESKISASFFQNVTLALVVGNSKQRPGDWPGEHRASFHPAAGRGEPLLRGLGLQENCLLRHDFGVSLRNV